MCDNVCVPMKFSTVAALALSAHAVYGFSGPLSGRTTGDIRSFAPLSSLEAVSKKSVYEVTLLEGDGIGPEVR